MQTINSAVIQKHVPRSGFQAATMLYWPSFEAVKQNASLLLARLLGLIPGSAFRYLIMLSIT